MGEVLLYCIGNRFQKYCGIRTPLAPLAADRICLGMNWC